MSVFYSQDRIFDCGSRVYFADYEAQGDSDVIISSYHTYVFPPWCEASSEKCLLLWQHFLKLWFHVKIKLF